MQRVSFRIHNHAKQTAILQVTTCRTITQAWLTAEEYINSMQISHQSTHQMPRNQAYSWIMEDLGTKSSYPGWSGFKFR